MSDSDTYGTGLAIDEVRTEGNLGADRGLARCRGYGARCDRACRVRRVGFGAERAGDGGTGANDAGGRCIDARVGELLE